MSIKGAKRPIKVTAAPFPERILKGSGLEHVAPQMGKLLKIKLNKKGGMDWHFVVT